ncbi:MAG: ABC transporter permease subunit [Gemmataceae bacterium]|nr:ABC transporter permease subunit [Gemmataceae bacterium]
MGDAAPRPPRRPLGERLGRVGRLVRKELSEILRDRRTIITLILMPLLLYPLLSLAFRQFLLANVGLEQSTEYRIGVSADEDQLSKEVVRIHLSPPLDLTAGAAPPALGVATGQAGSAPLNAATLLAADRLLPQPPPLSPLAHDPWRKNARPYPVVKFFEARDLEDAVRKGDVDVGIRLLQPPPDPRRRSLLNWRLLYLESSPRAREVLAYIEWRCTASNVQHARAQFEKARMPAWMAAPLWLVRVPLDEPEQDSPLSLAALIPLVLILMTITGAVYPAIDLTAGERERGTLEILVAAPVPRLALLFAKYVSVVTVAVLTATVNLVAMTVTLQLSGLGPMLFPGGGLTLGVVLQVFALLLLFAAFFSAVLLALTSFARSFKEAQAYLIPLMLAALAPGLVGMMPGLKLAGLYTITPLLNVVLLARDLFAGDAEAGPAVLVVLSTAVYALAAIAVAARIFGSEAVLYSEQSGWSDLFRRPKEHTPTASVTGALVCLALIFPAWFALASLTAGVALGAYFPLQAVVTLLLFVGIPLLAAAWSRVRPGSAFQLQSAPWLAFPAAVALGLALCPLVFGLLALLREAGLSFLGSEHARMLSSRTAEWRALSPLVVVGSVALAGALEELFFRGYLFSALRAASGARTAVVGSAVLFGLFHFPSAFDRLLPSTLMGLVLGWVCWRTGSVLPGMFLHAAYNGLFVSLVFLEGGGGGQEYLSLPWIGGALVLAVVGAAILEYVTRPRQPQTE